MRAHATPIALVAMTFVVGFLVGAFAWGTPATIIPLCSGFGACNDDPHSYVALHLGAGVVVGLAGAAGAAIALVARRLRR